MFKIEICERALRLVDDEVIKFEWDKIHKNVAYAVMTKSSKMLDLPIQYCPVCGKQIKIQWEETK